MPPKAIPTAALEKHMTFMERDTHRQNSSAVSILNALLREGQASRASDLHLNPTADAFVVRFRVDGNLYDAHSFPLLFHSEILARIKILAGLRTDEHQVPQDGRFRFESSSQSIDVRVSIAPTYFGENAILRLLSANHTLCALPSLGLHAVHQRLLERAATRPHGMILITGPTGCGKTSTLYAVLQLLNTGSRSIITIEDPVEYAVNGISQISTNQNAGLSFALGLRSILRQDPDIIGVGEIRDSETAHLATNAALTGHLVLSTLHTIDAPSALTRLMDLHIEPYLVASTVSVGVGQRLLPRLCHICRKRKALRKDQLERLKLVTEAYPSLPAKLNSHYVATGCNECHNSGVRGRIGVFEIMSMDETLREAVSRKASAQEFSALAAAQGMESLFCDGLRKVSLGLIRLDDLMVFIPDL
jgi:type IV pilus assembly protein PilB